jgi:hypothetical protein
VDRSEYVSKDTVDNIYKGKFRGRPIHNGDIWRLYYFKKTQHDGLDSDVKRCEPNLSLSAHGNGLCSYIEGIINS